MKIAGEPLGKIAKKKGGSQQPSESSGTSDFDGITACNPN
jgi:hypothetical protein